MSNNVIVQDNAPQSTAIATTSPMQLIELAIEKNADMERLEKLMDLQDRWEAKGAKKAFFMAMSNFQRDCPDIKKLKNAHNCKYAPLGDIINQVRILLADCGLSYRFEQKHENKLISVKCIVSHIDGHSESTMMMAPADESGKKSTIQAIASAVTYLSRYTFTSAFGITTADEDIDGRVPQLPPEVGSDPYAELEAALEGRDRANALIWISNKLRVNVTDISQLSPENAAKIAKALRAAK